MKNKIIIEVLKYLEAFAYKKADHIVPVTDSFKEYMISQNVDSDKITVIKNGVDLQFYEPESVALSNEFGIDFETKFVVSYFGTHGMAHHLETALEAAELLKNRKDITFVLVGDGAEKKKLERLKQEKKLKNVKMLAQQEKSKMPQLWALSDASLVLLKKSRLFKSVIPSKIFESMAMQTPIILGVEGEVKDMINDGQCGIPIEPENAKELAAAITLLADDKSLSDSYGRNGREYVTHYFDRKVLARKYEIVMESL